LSSFNLFKQNRHLFFLFRRKVRKEAIVLVCSENRFELHFVFIYYH